MIAAYSKNHTSLVREINLQDLGAFLIFDLGLRPRSKIQKAPRSWKCIYTGLVRYYITLRVCLLAVFGFR